MKLALIALALILTTGLNAQAAGKKRSQPERLCAWFQAKVDEECAHIMCDEEIANGTFKDLDECTTGEDYAEAAQDVCEHQPTTVEKLVKQYNKKHHTRIQCEE